MAPMVAYQVVEFGQPLARVVKPAPVPTGAQVVITIEYCGLCHSDLHLQQGNLGMLPGDAATRGRPRTLGHEPMGRVAALGPDAADTFSIGDRVVVYPFMGCGECTLCTVDGLDHLCFKQAVGFVQDGGFATHLLVPHHRYLFPIGHIQPQLAAVSACAGLTAFSSIRKMAIAGDAKHPVLMIGAGGVGMMALHLFKLMYPSHPGPVVVDLDAAKLAAVTAQGLCQRTIQLKPGEDATKVLRQASGAGGYTGVIDFVGNAASFKMALDAVQRGGRVVITGLFGGTINLPVTTFPGKAISVHGVFVGSIAEFRELMGLLERSKPIALPMHERPLADVSAALQDLHDGRVVGRIVLNATTEPVTSAL